MKSFRWYQNVHFSNSGILSFFPFKFIALNLLLGVGKKTTITLKEEAIEKRTQLYKIDTKINHRKVGIARLGKQFGKVQYCYALLKKAIVGVT